MTGMGVPGSMKSLPSHAHNDRRFCQAAGGAGGGRDEQEKQERLQPGKTFCFISRAGSDATTGRRSPAYVRRASASSGG